LHGALNLLLLSLLDIGAMAWAVRSTDLVVTSSRPGLSVTRDRDRTARPGKAMRRRSGETSVFFNGQFPIDGELARMAV
jgi:hypothetical protein